MYNSVSEIGINIYLHNKQWQSQKLTLV